MNKILEFWQNPDGSFSSRRLFGTLLIIGGVVGYFIKLDAAATGIVLGLGATLLGLTTADPKIPQ
jgi:hypothetical protein